MRHKHAYLLQPVLTILPSVTKLKWSLLLIADESFEEWSADGFR